MFEGIHEGGAEGGEGGVGRDLKGFQGEGGVRGVDYQGPAEGGGRGGRWIHYQELQIWRRGKLHTYQPTTETSLSSICPAENCGTLWHKATT